MTLDARTYLGVLEKLCSDLLVVQVCAFVRPRADLLLRGSELLEELHHHVPNKVEMCLGAVVDAIDVRTTPPGLRVALHVLLRGAHKDRPRIVTIVDDVRHGLGEGRDLGTELREGSLRLADPDGHPSAEVVDVLTLPVAEPALVIEPECQPAVIVRQVFCREVRAVVIHVPSDDR